MSVCLSPSLLFILIHPTRGLDCTMANTWLDCGVGSHELIQQDWQFRIYLFIHFAAAVKKKKNNSSHKPPFVPILLMFSYFIHEKHQWRAGGGAQHCMCSACLELQILSRFSAHTHTETPPLHLRRIKHQRCFQFSKWTYQPIQRYSNEILISLRGIIKVSYR